MKDKILKYAAFLAAIALAAAVVYLIIVRMRLQTVINQAEELLKSNPSNSLTTTNQTPTNKISNYDTNK